MVNRIKRVLARLSRWIDCLCHKRSVKVDYYIDGEIVGITRFVSLKLEVVYWQKAIPKEYAEASLYLPFYKTADTRPKYVKVHLTRIISFPQIVSFPFDVPVPVGAGVFVDPEGNVYPADYEPNSRLVGTVLSCECRSRGTSDVTYEVTAAIGGSVDG